MWRLTAIENNIGDGHGKSAVLLYQKKLFLLRGRSGDLAKA